MELDRAQREASASSGFDQKAGFPDAGGLSPPLEPALARAVDPLGSGCGPWDASGWGSLAEIQQQGAALGRQVPATHPRSLGGLGPQPTL